MRPPTSILPQALFSTTQTRELDRRAIQEFGIPGPVLMARAGAAAYRVLRTRWPAAQRVLVVCGTGNNGGDGYVLADLAQADGLSVQVVQVGDGAQRRGDALQAARAAAARGVLPSAYDGETAWAADVLVDALFGTGLDRELGGVWRQAVEAMNASARPVLALDIPSGLHGDTGAVLGEAVRATCTLSFIGLKPGLLTGAGPAHTGRLLFHDLEVPASVYANLTPMAERITRGARGECFPARAADAHKGRFGHVLVVGGDLGFGGAVRLAAEAAARVGAGLVSVATRAEHVGALLAARPELMVRAVAQAEDLDSLLARATVVVLGPGLGQDDWGRSLFARGLDHPGPLVLDADGLNLLSRSPRPRDDWILTPHPGEAGRLLGRAAAEVQRDRFHALAALRERYGGTVVLKGPGTLVLGPSGRVGLCDGGNPGMASGGMGDVLSGVIAGLVAQGWGPEPAARLGVWVHAQAGDRAAQAGPRGLLASDLLPWLRAAVNFDLG